MLYPKPCYNEPCYKEVVVYYHIKKCNQLTHQYSQIRTSLLSLRDSTTGGSADQKKKNLLPYSPLLSHCALRFFKITGKTFGKICIHLLRVHFKNDEQRTYLICSCISFLYSFFFCFVLIFFIKVYVVGTHLNCINKSMQFKWVPTTYAFIK